jgi:hypothetical protein
VGDAWSKTTHAADTRDLETAWGQPVESQDRGELKSLGIGATAAGDCVRRGSRSGPCVWPLPDALDDVILELRLYLWRDNFDKNAVLTLIVAAHLPTTHNQEGTTAATQGAPDTHSRREVIPTREKADSSGLRHFESDGVDFSIR